MCSFSSSELRTIVLQVYNAVGQFSTDWPSFMTITVLALLPVFVFFIFCQKWIVSASSPVRSRADRLID